MREIATTHSRSSERSHEHDETVRARHRPPTSAGSRRPKARPEPRQPGGSTAHGPEQLGAMPPCRSGPSPEIRTEIKRKRKTERSRGAMHCEWVVLVGLVSFDEPVTGPSTRSPEV